MMPLNGGVLDGDERAPNQGRQVVQNVAEYGLLNGGECLVPFQ